MTATVAAALDLLRRSVMLLPRSVAALILLTRGRRDRAQAQLLALDGCPAGPLTGSRRQLVGTALLVLPMAVLGLLAALFATLDEIRVIFLYGLTDGGSIGPGTWGGPTLAGAWTVHAVLGLVLLPVFAGVMFALTRLAALVVRRLRADVPRRGWILPVALLFDGLAVLFLIAFVRQL
jgi:hypothetical protein